MIRKKNSDAIPGHLYFQVPAGWNRQYLFQRLQQEFSVLKAESGRRLIRYYDTFDGRMHQAGMILTWDSSQVRAYRIDPPGSEIFCYTDREPRFAEELPPGLLKNKLLPVIEVRALLPLLEVNKVYQKIKFIDRHQKTVCYGYYEKNTVSRGETHKRLKPVFSISPLKGYPGFATRVSLNLQAMEFQPLQSDLYELACRKLQINPGGYSSKLMLRLDPVMDIRKAGQLILGQLLSTMEINEKGIYQDWDTEFLHDYRVAVRRIRSLFGQMCDYFPAEIYARARIDFPGLIQLSNRRRDLDVFLHHRQEYAVLLPTRYRRAIRLFFEYLEQQRVREHKKILVYLQSETCRQVKDFWNNFCLALPGLKFPEGQNTVTVTGLADGIIRKRYRKILKLEKTISEHMPDELLHRIRIECKKLRYSLEFFQSLADRDVIRQIIKKLKAVQDTLGVYHDWCIQEKQLYIYSKKIARRHPDLKSAPGAANSLVLKLQEKKIQLHVIFREQLADLCHPGLKKKMQNLFTGNPVL